MRRKAASSTANPIGTAVLGAAPPGGLCRNMHTSGQLEVTLFSICGTGDALPVRPCTDEQTAAPPHPGVSSTLYKRLSKVRSCDGTIVEELQFLSRLHGEASGQGKRRERPTWTRSLTRFFPLVPSDETDLDILSLQTLS